MSEWTPVQLGDVVTIKHGYAFKGEYFSSEGPGPILLTPGNFAIGGGFKHGRAKYYLGPVPDEFLLSEGDIVVSMTDLSKAGDTLGYSATVPEGGPYLHNQRVGLVRVTRPDLLCAEFLEYVLRSPDYRRHVLASATGSTVRHTSPSRLLNYAFLAPPLHYQRAIGAGLRALDDKIVTNERITGSLLDLADTFFKVASRGLVPGPKSFADVATVSGGGTPRTSVPEYWDGAVAWATPSDVTALSAPYLFRTSRTISEAGLDNSASTLYPVGSILMTSRATIGTFAMAQISLAVNQGFIVVVPRTREMGWWLFHEMRSRVDEMVSLANGSTFLELSRRNFRVMEPRLPDPERLTDFAARVAPLHEHAARRVEESRILARLRDALLLSLIANEIRISEFEWSVRSVSQP